MRFGEMTIKCNINSFIILPNYVASLSFDYYEDICRLCEKNNLEQAVGMMYDEQGKASLKSNFSLVAPFSFYKGNKQNTILV